MGMKKVGLSVSAVAVAALITFSAVSDCHAIAGAGFHWGFDFSMSMPKGTESMDIPGTGFKLDHFKGLDFLPGFTLDDTISDASPLKMSRSVLKRSAINFGGKLFVDVVPYVDIIELSFNLGVWQYDGSVSYLDVEAIGADPTLLTGTRPYKEVPVTLEEYGLGYFGLDKTPYAKLNFDLSVRKIVLNLWLIKFNAGAGFSLNFATPILDESLMDGVKVDNEIKSPEALVTKFMEPGSTMGKAIVEKILDELFTPRYAAHIVAGANLKLPAFPIGVYIDGKLMIPISKYDENKQVNGLGVMLNTGLALQF